MERTKGEKATEVHSPEAESVQCLAHPPAGRQMSCASSWFWRLANVGDRRLSPLELSVVNGNLLRALQLPSMIYFPYRTNDIISTICICVGSGWEGNNAYSQFYLGNSTSVKPVMANVYSSDKAIYLSSSTYGCSANKITTNAAPCNWDLLFSEDSPSALI